jgi:hypothetical protein
MQGHHRSFDVSLNVFQVALLLVHLIVMSGRGRHLLSFTPLIDQWLVVYVVGVPRLIRRPKFGL